MKSVTFEKERLAGPGGLIAELLDGDVAARALFPPGSFIAALPGAAYPSPRPSRLEPDHLVTSDSDTSRRLARVLEGGGHVVTTGQQPQLFGGPLYVLYKALSAARLAGRIEAQTGQPGVAVFWVAGDDHDWAEVASVGFLDTDESYGRIDVQPPPELAGSSVGPSPLGDGIGQTVQDFLGGVTAGEAGARWAELLQREYQPDRTFSQAFIGVLSEMTRGLPIAFLDATHPGVRHASISLIQEVLEDRQGVDEALRAGTEAVRGLGYRPQLGYVEGAIPVFREAGQGRHRLRGTSGAIQVAPDGTSLQVEEVVLELSGGGHFSPSAALRPVLESWLLPVSATVLGPGEMAYWAQLGPLFERLRVPMPVVEARDSWRIVERRVARLLEKTGVSAGILGGGLEEATAGLIERSRPRSVEEALLRLEEHADRGLSEMDGIVSRDLPGLRPAVGKGRAQVFAALASVRKAMDRMTRDRERAAIAQLQRASTHLYPGGVPQERSIAIWAFLSRYGDDFLDAALKASATRIRGDVSSPGSGVAGESAGD
jgi:bacillithiol biosynthesis cysteine-adding enzyme BshC